jgi:hypothetical protein
MEQQHGSGVSDYSPTSPTREPKVSERIDTATPSFDIGVGPGKERGDDDHEYDCGASDYSPPQRDPATTGYFDTGGEDYRYSPTSPRYSRPASLCALSDYSPREEGYEGASASSHAFTAPSPVPKRDTVFNREPTVASRPDGSHLQRKRDGDPRNRQITSTNTTSRSKQHVSTRTGKKEASHETHTSHTGDAFGARFKHSLRHDSNQLDDSSQVWKHATRHQEFMQNVPSVEFVQFLIARNEHLSERLSKVESALALVQSQIEPREKAKNPDSENEHAREQRESVVAKKSEKEKTENALQRERLKLAWDVCIVICAILAIVVLLQIPRLLGVVMGLVNQKMENLRLEQSAHCNAGP